MRREAILEAIYDPANRANPTRSSPSSARRRSPGKRTVRSKGTCVVSTYRELVALLHDPRLSSDLRKGEKTAGRARR